MMGDLAGADAIRKVMLRMQSSGGGTRVSIDDRRAWFKGIITHYQQQCVNWRRFNDARPILARSVTAMAESYSVKSLLVHLREKLGTTTPPRDTDQNGPPNVKEQRRKREQEQKRKAEKEKRRKDRERTNKDARPGSQTQTRNSAWSDRPADIPSA